MRTIPPATLRLTHLAQRSSQFRNTRFGQADQPQQSDNSNTTERQKAEYRDAAERARQTKNEGLWEMLKGAGLTATIIGAVFGVPMLIGGLNKTATSNREERDALLALYRLEHESEKGESSSAP